MDNYNNQPYGPATGANNNPNGAYNPNGAQPPYPSIGGSQPYPNNGQPYPGGGQYDPNTGQPYPYGNPNYPNGPRQPMNGGYGYPYGPQPPKKKSGKGGIIFIVLLILALLGGGAYYYFDYTKSNSEEETAYEVLENNNNPQDYEDFLEKYPNSSYASEVRQRLTKLREMLDRWQLIAYSDNVNDFKDFKSAFDDPQYTQMCDMKIDSLDYVEAKREGTPEAFQRYLNNHPDGRYTADANMSQGRAQETVVTEENSRKVEAVIDQFFDGFSNRDEEVICENIASTMTSFLHQSNVSKATVLSTINKMFNEHILSCNFNVNRDMEVSRSGKGYAASFTVDQHIDRDNEGKTFGQYRCRVVLNENMLITSVTMDEVKNTSAESTEVDEN